VLLEDGEDLAGDGDGRVGAEGGAGVVDDDGDGVLVGWAEVFGAFAGFGKDVKVRRISVLERGVIVEGDAYSHQTRCRSWRGL
jgi:hypothetical protein